ncbi:MAG: fibronectin type III domain-containing protein, partial [Bacteroidetes bacterium]|nr:fibronectin type III domain-containing protein [Bacteroidota bacterium]
MKKLLFVFGMIIIGLTSNLMNAQTNVSGVISTNTTWTINGSPYNVTDNIQIPTGITLTIKAGVIVKFYGGMGIVVKGNIIAKGTKDSVINFTKYSGTNWNSISITSNDTSVFYYCKLNYGVNSIAVDGSNYSFHPSLIVNKCWISNNIESGVYVRFTQGFISIDSSYFLNNSTGVYFNWLLSASKLSNSVIWKSSQYGIRCNVSQFDINKNEIYENKIGIYFTSNQTNFIKQNNIINNDIGIFNDYTNGTSYTTVNFNNITRNILYNFKNGSSSGFSFPNNWWGSAQINNIDSLILDEKDNISLGLVNYLPFLSKPDTSTHPISPANLKILSAGKDYISVLWDSTLNSNQKGYKVYYDTDSSGYSFAHSIDVGNVTSYKLSGLATGKKYFITVIVYDLGGNESWYSNEVSATTVPPFL